MLVKKKDHVVSCGLCVKRHANRTENKNKLRCTNAAQPPPVSQGSWSPQGSLSETPSGSVGLFEAAPRLGGVSSWKEKDIL